MIGLSVDCPPSAQLVFDDTVLTVLQIRFDGTMRGRRRSAFRALFPKVERKQGFVNPCVVAPSFSRGYVRRCVVAPCVAPAAAYSAPLFRRCVGRRTFFLFRCVSGDASFFVSGVSFRCVGLQCVVESCELRSAM